jgi:hypothetical protein
MVLGMNLGFAGTGALLFVIGLVLALRRNARTTIALISSSALLYAVVGSFLLCIPRQILPILPAAVILCALPGAVVLDKLIGSPRPIVLSHGVNVLRMPLAWFGVAMLVPFFLLFVQRVGDVADTRLPDTRLQLLAWLDTNVPDGAHVLREADTPRMDELSRRCTVQWASSAVFRDGRAHAASADFLVINGEMRAKVQSLAAHLPREQALYDELFERADPLVTFSKTDGKARGPTFYVFGALPQDLREHFAAP